MGSLLKLSVFLLCIEIALALKCRLCSSYTYLKCDYEMMTCIAKENESCMTTRFWIPPYTANFPKDGISMCMQNCEMDDYDYGIYAALITCCNTHDFCNDMHIPVDL